MKTHLIILFVLFMLICNCPFAKAVAIRYTRSAESNYNLHLNHNSVKRNSFNDLFVSNDTDPHLRLQLAKDSINTDDIYIAFEANAKTQYVFNEDAPYMQGYGQINLASISSDNIKLAINRLPLPQKSETIKLFVSAKKDGNYSLNMIEDEDLPEIYEVWLMDAYKKDSLDIRHNPTYAFNLLKADTNSYGTSRFSLVIRQNLLLSVHLLDFTAIKTSAGAQIAWKTENEYNYTNFTIERSSDGGNTYNALNASISNTSGFYSFLDKTPPVAIDLYRLKIMDLGGVISYSSILTLVYSNSVIAHNNLNIYPNPARGIVNFSLVPNNGLANSSVGGPIVNSIPAAANTSNAEDASYAVKIINLSGAVIRSATSSTQNWQTDVSNLMPGTYIIQMINNIDNSIIGKSTFIKL